jgi:hypothetical protein
MVCFSHFHKSQMKWLCFYTYTEIKLVLKPSKEVFKTY